MKPCAAAAERVNLLDFVEQMPEQFATPVRERGQGLSTGQKQLISFARALAHNARIFILDEATSSVDTDTEFRVREALSRLVENRTSLVIAHRLSTIQRADRIIVMHRGQLREMGTHRELLARRDIYWKLYQLQYKEQEIERATRTRASTVHKAPVNPPNFAFRTFGKLKVRHKLAFLHNFFFLTLAASVYLSVIPLFSSHIEKAKQRELQEISQIFAAGLPMGQKPETQRIRRLRISGGFGCRYWLKLGRQKYLREHADGTWQQGQDMLFRTRRARRAIPACSSFA